MRDLTEAILETFARYFAVIPNLYAFEVMSTGTHYSRPPRKALHGVKLPRSGHFFHDALSSPPLSKHRPPHIHTFYPNEEWVESLAMGQQKLRSFSVSFPGDAIAGTGEECPERIVGQITLRN